jgi:hypothetical protein
MKRYRGSRVDVKERVDEEGAVEEEKHNTMCRAVVRRMRRRGNPYRSAIVEARRRHQYDVLMRLVKSKRPKERCPSPVTAGPTKWISCAHGTLKTVSVALLGIPLSVCAMSVLVALARSHIATITASTSSSVPRSTLTSTNRLSNRLRLQLGILLQCLLFGVLLLMKECLEPRLPPHLFWLLTWKSPHAQSQLPAPLTWPLCYE